MSGVPDSVPAGPSPVEVGSSIASRWGVGQRLAVRGDLHVYAGTGSVDTRIVAWRYRGSEPLPRFLQHLSEDAMAWGALRHAHLVPTLDCGRVTGQTTCFWVTEDPGGPVLADLLADRPLVAPEAALQIALHVGHGVLAAHLVGLVHGDLDPANIHLVGSRARARLAWGGLATRVEHSGMDAGRGTTRSLAEVAPEALRGRLPTPRSDTYALCALLFRLLAGQPPFLVRKGGPPPGLARGDHLEGLPSWVAPPVGDALALGLAADPDHRPTDLSELLERLAACEAEVRGTPPPRGTWTPPPSTASPTPSTAHRTVSPVARAAEPASQPGRATPLGAVDRTAPRAPTPIPAPENDPALVNTPPSASTRIPSPRTGLKSLVPAAPQMETRSRPPDAAPPARAPSLVGPAVVIGAAVLLGFALLALVLWRPPTPPVAPVPVPVPVAVPEPVPPARAGVLTLRTDPPGAEVWEGDYRVGTTPLELVLDGRPDDPPRVLELRLAGYATHTVRQPWSATPVEHLVPLQKVQPSPPRPAPTVPPLKENR